MSDEEHLSRDPETHGSESGNSTGSSFSPEDILALFFLLLKILNIDFIYSVSFTS